MSCARILHVLVQHCFQKVDQMLPWLLVGVSEHATPLLTRPHCPQLPVAYRLKSVHPFGPRAVQAPSLPPLQHCLLLSPFDDSLNLALCAPTSWLLLMPIHPLLLPRSCSSSRAQPGCPLPHQPLSEFPDQHQRSIFWAPGASGVSLHSHTCSRLL